MRVHSIKKRKTIKILYDKNGENMQNKTKINKYNNIKKKK